jgi:hypothetical protein
MTPLFESAGIIICEAADITPIAVIGETDN